MVLAMVPNLNKFDEQMKNTDPKVKSENINNMVKVLKSNPYSFYSNYKENRKLFNECMKKFGDIGVDKKEDPIVVLSAQKAFNDSTLSKFYHDLNSKK